MRIFKLLYAIKKLLLHEQRQQYKMLLRCFKLVFNKYTLVRLLIYFKITFYPKQSIDNTLLMQTEPSTPQDHKTVHDHLKHRSRKVLLCKGLKPVTIQFYTNRCHTRTITPTISLPNPAPIAATLAARRSHGSQLDPHYAISPKCVQYSFSRCYYLYKELVFRSRLQK
jgi:hypothetical protein